MRTTVNIDDKLLEQAKKLFPNKTISEIVHLAFLNYVENFKPKKSIN